MTKDKCNYRYFLQAFNSYCGQFVCSLGDQGASGFPAVEQCLQEGLASAMLWRYVNVFSLSLLI